MFSMDPQPKPLSRFTTATSNCGQVGEASAWARMPPLDHITAVTIAIIAILRDTLRIVCSNCMPTERNDFTRIPTPPKPTR